MKVILGLFVFHGFVIGLLAAPIPKDLKKKGAKLEGVWEVTSISIGNSDYTGKSGQRWTIEGETLKLDDYTEASKRIDKLVPVEAGDQLGLNWVINESGTTRTYKGIYDIEDGVWRFCFSTTPDHGERPTTIGKGKTVYLYTFKRAEGK
jgi:uncharacterized protein (TIGR03067 family)